MSMTDTSAAPLRLLMINPNTSEPITARLKALAEDEAGEFATIGAITARFGATYISDRAGAVVAAHAVLDAAAASLETEGKPDAIVIGCFGDPGLRALQETTGLPVAGFAEAGLLAAAAEPGPFMVATNGDAWCVMLAELAREMGLSERIVSFLSIGDDGASDAAICSDRITKEAGRTGAKRVVLGGAGLIPILAEVSERLALPVVDPHRAAIRKAIAQARTDIA
jgi:allantoin racemase